MRSSVLKKRPKVICPRAYLLGLVSLIVVCGCQSQNQEKHYSLKGRVMAKDASTQQITVDNEDIPGFMPAMTMPYPVKDPKGLNTVQPGDVISADVVVRTGQGYWLQNLAITDESGRGTVPVSTAPQALKLGEKPPDVEMINQDGKPLHFRLLKGRTVLLTFIYTRCPLPNFCPLISTEFATIHKDLGKDSDDLKRTHLISVSLDPAYDTAPVLRKYGLAYLQGDASGFKHWDFVFTNVEDLKKLASAFGFQYFAQDNQISHSMQTVLLAPDGTIAKYWPGNEWKTSEVLAAMKQSEVASK